MEVMSASCSARFNPTYETSRYPLCWRLDGLRNLSERCDQEKKSREIIVELFLLSSLFSKSSAGDWLLCIEASRMIPLKMYIFTEICAQQR